MSLKSFLKKIKSAESAISVILGIAVVVVVGIMLFNYFRNYSLVSKQAGKTGEGAQTEETQPGETGGTRGSLPTKYVVAAGDSLWKISEKFYGSGYNWQDISKENKINAPNQLAVGQELAIPKIASKKAAVPAVSAAKTVEGAISGSQYQVVKGDTLWKISVRAYQDGYKWTEIAKANHLVHPSLIHPGNVLVIPR